jgi:hypothetical protein
MCLCGHVLSWEEELHSDLHHQTLSRNSLVFFSDCCTRQDAFIREPEWAGSLVSAARFLALCKVTGPRITALPGQGGA